MKITVKQITCLILATTTIGMVGCTTQTKYGRSTGEYIDDRTVARNVKSALNDDSLTETSDIKVDSFRGNVHLTGFVQHPVQKEQAGKIARRVKGVQYFKNDIIVQSELPTERATQGTTMREPSGAEINQSQKTESNLQNSSESSDWQDGSGAAAPKTQSAEPVGAEPTSQPVEPAGAEPTSQSVEPAGAEPKTESVEPAGAETEIKVEGEAEGTSTPEADVETETKVDE